MRRNVRRILLVEADGVLAEVTAFRLELLGYQVEVTTTQEQALHAARNLTPDLIIADMMLEEDSALPLLESLASQPETNGIPVMVLSLDADLDRVTEAHKAGAADFLVVPYQPDVLQRKVAALLSRGRAPGEREKSKTLTT
ncbi:MAG: PleD family two-component system response regulator [Pirellulaceae bacterium]